MNRKCFAAVLAAAALMLSACGSSAGGTGVFAGKDSSPAEPAAAADYSAAESDAAAQEPEGGIASLQNSYDIGAEDSDGSSVYDEAAQQYGQKIVRSASLTLQTIHYDECKQQLQDLMNRYQCLITSEEENSSDWDWYYTEDGDGSLPADNSDERSLHVVAGVPTSQLDSFLRDMDGVNGKIMNRSMNADNMTRTYSQNADKIASLEEEQRALNDLLSRAEEVEDMIAIQQELANVRAQLQDLNNSNDQIDFDVNYSSVTIDLDEVNAFTPTSEDSFPERLAYALSHSLEAFINVLKGIVIGIIYLLPYAVIAAAAVFLIRRWRKRRPHRDGQLKRRHRHGKSGEDGSSGPSDRKSSQDTVDGKEVDQNAAGMTGTGTETTQ